MISSAPTLISSTPNPHLPQTTVLASSAPGSQPAPSRQSLYEGSSQYRHWRFSPEQLAATRASLNAAAVKAIKDAFETDSVHSQQTNILYCVHVWHKDLSARLVKLCSVSEPAGGICISEVVCGQGCAIVRPLSIFGRSRGYGYKLLEALLSQKYRDGLASEERYVRGWPLFIETLCTLSLHCVG